jgi:hypothetical protein
MQIMAGIKGLVPGERPTLKVGATVADRRISDEPQVIGFGEPEEQP